MSGNVQASVQPAGRRLQLIEERLIKFNRPYAEKFDYKLLKLDARQVQLDPAGAPSADFAFFTPCQGNLPGINDPRIDMDFFPYDEQDPALQHRKHVHVIDRARILIHCMEDYLPVCELDVLPANRGAWRYQPIINYNFGVTLSSFDNPEWQAMHVAHIPGRQHPHLLLFMMHDIDGKPHLLRGELLAITRALAGQLALRKFSHHRTAPILVFSFMGPQHGRILQAYLEGENLVVRYSELYDFTTWNNNAQLFARWALSIPAGNTR